MNRYRNCALVIDSIVRFIFKFCKTERSITILSISYKLQVGMSGNFGLECLKHTKDNLFLKNHKLQLLLF